MHPIPTPDFSKDSDIQARIDNKTKPPGSLGLLEKTALQIARIQQTDHIDIHPEMLIFAADHAWPQTLSALRHKPSLRKWCKISLPGEQQLTASAYLTMFLSGSLMRVC